MYKSLSKIFNIIDKHGVYMSHAEQKKNVKLYQETKEQKYKDLVLSANYRSIYTQSRSLSKTTGVDPYDLFIEGCYGMGISFDNFDVDSDNTFYTYAIWNVKKMMYKFIEDTYGDGIHIPANVVRTFPKQVIEGTQNKIEQFSTVKNSSGEDVDPLDIIPQDTFVSGTHLEDEITNKQVREIIETMISELPELDRKMFISTKEGYTSCADYAKVYGKDKNTYTARQRKIMENLQMKLSHSLLG